MVKDEYTLVLVKPDGVKTRTDEIGMLYTMATRAMHDLTMISNGQVSTAINEKASQQLTIEHELIR